MIFKIGLILDPALAEFCNTSYAYFLRGAVHKYRYEFFEILDPSLPLVTHLTK